MFAEYTAHIWQWAYVCIQFFLYVFSASETHYFMVLIMYAFFIFFLFLKKKRCYEWRIHELSCVCWQYLIFCRKREYRVSVVDARWCAYARIQLSWILSLFYPSSHQTHIHTGTRANTHHTKWNEQKTLITHTNNNWGSSSNNTMLFSTKSEKPTAAILETNLMREKFFVLFVDFVDPFDWKLLFEWFHMENIDDFFNWIDDYGKSCNCKMRKIYHINREKKTTETFLSHVIAQYHFGHKFKAHSIDWSTNKLYALNFLSVFFLNTNQIISLELANHKWFANYNLHMKLDEHFCFHSINWISENSLNSLDKTHFFFTNSPP